MLFICLYMSLINVLHYLNVDLRKHRFLYSSLKHAFNYISFYIRLQCKQLFLYQAAFSLAKY